MGYGCPTLATKISPGPEPFYTRIALHILKYNKARVRITTSYQFQASSNKRNVSCKESPDFPKSSDIP